MGDLDRVEVTVEAVKVCMGEVDVGVTVAVTLDGGWCTRWCWVTSSPTSCDIIEGRAGG